MPKNQVLSFNNTSIRVVVDSDNEPLFCLVDICKALKLTANNAPHIANKIKLKFELNKLNSYSFNTDHGIKNCTIITKSQLYFVLMRSRKAEAKELRAWVDSEVLPSIKKNENHSLEQDTPVPKSYGELLLEAGRLALENEKLLAQIKEKENQPKIEAKAETKTILKREFLGSEISQKSENGYFSATDLFKVANQLRVKKGLNFKDLHYYNSLKSTKEFEEQLSKKYMAREYKYGRGEHLWVHPFLFADMALWLFNPDFKLEVYEWIFNDLPKYIDDSCKGE